MKDYRLIVVVNAAIGQSVISEVTKELVNRSYLKSQKLKETAADRQRIKLLEEENDILKKDKASLEQKVELLKEVI